MKNISVIVPVCNEAGIIENNIRKLDGFLRRNYSSYEIIAAEDGSTDGTDKILHSMSNENKNIIHLHSRKRLGKGRALNNAFFSSSGNRIFMIDADFPVSLGYISKMLGYLERKDIVIGSRMMKGSVVKRPLSRFITSLSYNTLVRLLFHTGVRDHQCGVKAFQRKALSRILPAMGSNNFFWDTEMLVRAKKHGYRIAEIPIEWNDRKTGKSKVFVSRESLKMARNLIKFWYSSSKGSRS